MKDVTLSSFYNHRNFMKDVREGELLLLKSEKELIKRKVETTSIKIGDRIVSTGKGTIIEGMIGEVVNIELVGKFLRFSVDWDFENKKKKHYVTSERKCDITII